MRWDDHDTGSWGQRADRFSLVEDSHVNIQVGIMEYAAGCVDAQTWCLVTGQAVTAFMRL